MTIRFEGGDDLTFTQFSGPQSDISLGGTLKIEIVGPFDPPLGSRFTLLNFRSISGRFQAVHGLSINHHKRFEIDYLPTAVQVVVVANIPHNY